VRRTLKGFVAIEIAVLLATLYAMLVHSFDHKPLYNPGDVDPYDDILIENGDWSRDPAPSIIESSA
jgi:hypothetical protein